jgi:adenosine 3'-phospho 5'-phosphosulfate transporter B2
MLVRFYLEEDVTYDTVETVGEDYLEKEPLMENKSADSIEANKAQRKGEGASDIAPSLKSNIVKKNSFLDVEKSSEPEGSKEDVLQRLCICSAGLISIFCCWGLLQERMLTQPYRGDYFEYSYGLVFMTRFGGVVLSAALMYYYGIKWEKTVLWEYAFPSVANMMSSWCQYESLKFVSFPTTMLFKAFKMVPVMLYGKFMMDKKYETYEYMSGLTVGFGLFLFLTSSENVDFHQNVFGDPGSVTGSLCGVVLLILFLIFDSATGQWQTRIFSIHPNLSPLQMMFIMNAFSAVFSFITLVNQEELDVTMEYITKHPLFSFHLLLFILASIVGQLFIFYTVKSFGPVVFSIIMAMRILCSTLLSCFTYQHGISELGVVGILITFGALSYRIQRKSSQHGLIRWKDKPVPASPHVVFNEWREHTDI